MQRLEDLVGMKIRMTSRFDVPFIEALGASAVIGRVNRPKRSGKYRAGFPGLRSRFVRVVEACSIAAGGLALTVLAGLTVVAMFRRYALNDPIFGAEDLSAMTLTIVAAAVAGAARPGSADGLDRLKALPRGRFQQLGAPT